MPFLVITLGYSTILNLVLMNVCPAGVNYWGQPFVLTSNVIYFLLIPAYLIFYAATVIDSPSRTALRLIKNRNGLTYAELLKSIGGSEFILTRLNSLMDYQLITVLNGKYQLLPKGKMLGGILNIFKFVLGREPGG